jgi:hypothetical protein
MHFWLKNLGCTRAVDNDYLKKEEALPSFFGVHCVSLTPLLYFEPI